MYRQPRLSPLFPTPTARNFRDSTLARSDRSFGAPTRRVLPMHSYESMRLSWFISSEHFIMEMGRGRRRGHGSGAEDATRFNSARCDVMCVRLKSSALVDNFRRSKCSRVRMHLSTCLPGRLPTLNTRHSLRITRRNLLELPEPVSHESVLVTRNLMCASCPKT